MHTGKRHLPEPSVLSGALLRPKAVRIVFTSALLALTLVSCGGRAIGYGLVLWSPDEAVVPTGEVLAVQAQSEIAKTYTVALPDRDTGLTLEQWRVQFFDEKEQADAFAETFAPYRTLYAQSGRDALPVRDAANQGGRRVYGLREGEVIKILGRTTEEEVNVGGLSGYWYQVMTETGVRGYTFSRLLTVTEGAGGAPIAAVQQTPQEDPDLTRFLSNVWRPDYFQTMIENNAIDLERFSSRYGVFPVIEQNVITVVTPNYTAAFPYENITRLGSGMYTLDLSSFRFTIRPRFVSIQYSYGGSEYAAAYVLIEQNLDDVVSAELDRRRQVFERFLENGSVLRSSAYGTISLAPDQTFSWEGLGRLVPSVIPATAGTRGFVEFRTALSRELAATWDGVISFRFEGLPAARYITFLFDFTGTGVQFVYVQDRDITNNTVLQEPVTPIVMFFTFSQ